MKRRDFMKSGLISMASAVALGAQPSTSKESPIIVMNPGYRLLIDPDNGSLISMESTYGAKRQLLVEHQASLPLFKIELMSAQREFKTISSSEAAQVNIKSDIDESGAKLTIDYTKISQLPVDARVTVRCPVHETLAYWSIEVNNGTDSWIGHIQFPVLKIPFDGPGERLTNHLMWSSVDGVVVNRIEPACGDEDCWGIQQDALEAWRFPNYPGQWTSAQLMAYYNDLGGLYVACDDSAGLPKLFGPLTASDGVTLGLGHYPGTRGPGKAVLPYSVVFGTFQGDWYAAAEIYRTWAKKQAWCSQTLSQRKDYPSWLFDSPVALIFPTKGQTDHDPAITNPEYTPLTNALPYLEKKAEELAAPLMPVVFNWEHAGPWVQPDSFPPAGGEEPFRKFMTEARAKGWHPDIYGDGLNWVTWQKDSNYDGMAYFNDHGGEDIAVRNWDGTLIQENDGWRKCYAVCIGTQKGREMVLDHTSRMAELGPDVIQQFDQGPGARTCYAPNHDHPPVPGPWLTETFKALLEADMKVARSINPSVAMSTEGFPPEVYVRNFHMFDARATRNGNPFPLLQFIYHEYMVGIAGLGFGNINDEAMRASIARALVEGYAFDLNLRDHGRIHYGWEYAWSSNAVPDQAAILDWAKRANRIRAGVARDYLIFGRMLRPWSVTNTSTRTLVDGTSPSVMSGTWQSPKGTIAVVLANYTNDAETPLIELEREGPRKIILHSESSSEDRRLQLPATISLSMNPRSISMIEVEPG